MTEDLRAGADEDPRVAALLRVNAELAAEIRSFEAGRIQGARSAAAPTARRLGRLLTEREGLIEEVERLRAELAEREAELDAETARAAALEQERVRLVGKIDEYGDLVEALQAEVERLRGGLAGILRRGASRVAPSGRRSR